MYGAKFKYYEHDLDISLKQEQAQPPTADLNQKKICYEIRMNGIPICNADNMDGAAMTKMQCQYILQTATKRLTVMPYVVEIEFMNLTEPIHSHLLNNKNISDVSFVVEGQTLYGVSLMLCQHSDFFRVLLRGPFKESKTRSAKNQSSSVLQSTSSAADSPPIPLKDVTYLATKRCFSWIYSKEINDDEATGLQENLDLLNAADRFNLTDLVKVVILSIEKIVTTSNFGDVFVFAEQRELESLRRVAIQVWKDARQGNSSHSKEKIKKQVDVVHQFFQTASKETILKWWLEFTSV
jgi:hypothetical protein